MNTRQTKKKLKKQIDRLKSDNALMRNIIENSPKMAEQYDMWTRPLNVIQSQVHLDEYRCKRIMPLDYDEAVVEVIKHTMESEMLDLIKNNITYEFSTEYSHPSLIGKILIGRK
jgi:hypothetical protein